MVLPTRHMCTDGRSAPFLTSAYKVNLLAIHSVPDVCPISAFTAKSLTGKTAGKTPVFETARVAYGCRVDYEHQTEKACFLGWRQVINPFFTQSTRFPLSGDPCDLLLRSSITSV